MATWKLAPALAAGNCVVLKPAEQTPTSIMVLMELIQDVLPPGVINVITGYGAEAGDALAHSKGIAKLAFTGSTATGTHVLKAAADSLIPTTLELGGKSPNIFFSSVCARDDAFLDKAVEGAVLFALNQGEVCTCQSRLLVQEDIYDQFMERVVARTEAIKTGDPLDPSTMMGAQVSKAQQERIVRYLEIGQAEGAKVLTGGAANDVISGGYYIKPTILAGTNDMKVFQEEIFGPVTGRGGAGTNATHPRSPPPPQIPTPPTPDPHPHRGVPPAHLPSPAPLLPKARLTRDAPPPHSIGCKEISPNG